LDFYEFTDRGNQVFLDKIMFLKTCTFTVNINKVGVQDGIKGRTLKRHIQMGYQIS